MPGVDIIGLIQFPNVFNLIIVTYSWLYCDFQIRSTKRKLVKKKKWSTDLHGERMVQFSYTESKICNKCPHWRNLIELNERAVLCVTVYNTGHLSFPGWSA